MSDTAGSRVRQSRQADDGDYWPSDRGGGRGGRNRRSGSGGGSGKLFIGAAVGVLVIAVLAVVGVLAMSGGGSKTGTQAALGGGTVTQNPPTVYDPQPVSDGTGKLNSRKAADSRPWNKGEIFTAQAKKVNAGPYTFTQVASDLSTDCASVTWGAELQADLQKYGCTQIARMAYLSDDHKYSGQAIAINLDSLDGSKAILRDLIPGSGGFVKPLAGPGINNFAAGFSAAYPMPFGHYVLIPWVQRNGGGKPNSMNELIEASLAVEHGNDFAWQRLIDARG